MIELIYYGLKLVIRYILKTTTFGKVLPKQIEKSVKLCLLTFFFSAKCRLHLCVESKKMLIRFKKNRVCIKNNKIVINNWQTLTLFSGKTGKFSTLFYTI